MSAYIYLEGGGDSKELHARCREGFRKLLERCGFTGHMPRLVACGGREDTFDDFKTAHEAMGADNYIAMIIDSEDPVVDIEKVWEHLQKRDGWTKPESVTDEQAHLMTTCMETWIVSDRAGLKSHYGSELQESSLPPLVDMEMRSRQAIQATLVQATKKCQNSYRKGKRSFEVLSKLDPATLVKYLPSFVRVLRILGEKL